MDVQGTYFAVQITAWGVDGRGQVIDRFDLTEPPAEAPNLERDEEGRSSRRLRPARYAEDWQVLESLIDRVYPVEGETWGLRPFAASIDFQGEPGVSDNAEKFILARRAEGLGQVWFTTRGHGGFKVPRRVWYETPERGSKGKRARSIKLLNIATDRVKDTVYAKLQAAEDAADGFMLGAWQDDEQRLEYVSEARDGKTGWNKKPGVVRNEGFDLSVMARALVEHKGMLRLDPANLPAWALGGTQNPFAVAEVPDETAPVVRNEAARKRPTLPTQVNFLSRR